VTRKIAAVPSVTKERWGSTDEGDVFRYALANANGMRVGILSYGGIVQSVEVPDRDGRLANVTLGFDNLTAYVEHDAYFGCIAGRYAGRIAGGRFALDGVGYELPVNDPPNSLHGGLVGFDRHVWASKPLESHDGVGVQLVHTSPDGDQGYPGALRVEASYTLTNDDEIVLGFRATTDRKTVVNLTNHTYWNLAGEGSGSILGHVLLLNASRYTPDGPTRVPTGALAPVAGTPMDFTTPTAIGARIDDPFEQLAIAGGYDQNFVLDGVRKQPVAAAQLTEPTSGRVLEISTDQPGIQLYSGNLLDGTLVGTGGHAYGSRDGLALETQHFPDSPNHPGFPSTVVEPGRAFESTTIYRFSPTYPGYQTTRGSSGPRS
jgi:aldose 1-epimerase